MKREVISEALSDISEDYIREALELRGRVVADGDSMKKSNNKKKIVTVALAAALVAALGATAYAAIKGAFGMKSNEPEPGETRVIGEYETTEADVDISSLPLDDTIDESDRELIESLQAEETNASIINVTKYFTFEGVGKCNEIEFKLNDVPENYTRFDGSYNVSGWYSVCQGVELDEFGLDLNVFNVNVYYATDFGPDGSLFLEDTIISENTYEEDTDIFYELVTKHPDSENNSYYYMVYDTISGRLIIVSTSTGMEDSIRIYNGLEIQETGKELEYIEGAEHDIWLVNAVG